MKVKLRKEYNAYAQGEVVYVAKTEYDVDARYGTELISTGKFEEVKEKKEAKGELE